MRVDAFDFELPEESIALRPARPRDSARMLIVKDSGLIDRGVKDLVDELSAGDVLVFNLTKVIPAQLHGIRVREHIGGQEEPEGAKVGFTLHKQVELDRWVAFARPAKKVPPGSEIWFDHRLSAKVIGREGAEVELLFSCGGGKLVEAMERVGEPPLPPYIASKRETDDQDVDDYQTVYARDEGSVAAPTAGLHFTDELLASLEAKGVKFAWVTLHVGAGTFLPVKVEDTEDHVMHSEWGEVSQETANLVNKARAEGNRVIAVGTTSLRLLESAASEDGLHPFCDETDIFITPGYSFKVVDALMTNFHLPKSTLFMLVSALAGLETMQAAYKHAIDSGYRFYSYGDSSLLYRASE